MKKALLFISLPLLFLCSSQAYNKTTHEFLKENKMTSTSYENFEAQRGLSRAALAKFSYHFATTVMGQPVYNGISCIYEDRSSYELEQYASKVCQLKLMGIDSQGDPLKIFGFNERVTKAQFFTVILRLLKANASLPSSWSQQYINRGDAAYIFMLIDKALAKKKSDEKSTSSEATKEKVEEESTTETTTQTIAQKNEILDKAVLNATLTPPLQNYIPSTSSASTIGKLSLNASNQAVTITGITFSIESMTNRDSISYITLRDERNLRISSQKVFNNVMEATLHFMTPLVIEPGKKRELQIVIGTKNFHGEIIELSIRHSKHIHTAQDVSINGSLKQDYTNQKEQEEAIDQNIKIRNTSHEQIIVPDQETSLASFEFKCLYDSCEIKELTFINLEADSPETIATQASDAVTAANGAVITLYREGKKVTTTSIVDGIVSFNFRYPLLLPRNEERTLHMTIQAKKINDASQSNSPISLALLRPGERYNETYQTRILSQANGKELGGDDYLTAQSKNATQYIRKAEIMINPVSQNSTFLGNNQGADLYRFRMASSDQKIILKEIRRDASLAGDVILDNFALYIDSRRIHEDDIERSTNDTQKCAAASSFTQTQINAGGTSKQGCIKAKLKGSLEDGYTLKGEKTITLQGAINNSSGQDSISIRLNEAGNTAERLSYSSLATKPGSLIWSDDAAEDLSLSSHNRYNDTHTEGLPLPSWNFN